MPSGGALAICVFVSPRRFVVWVLPGHALSDLRNPVTRDDRTVASNCADGYSCLQLSAMVAALTEIVLGAYLGTDAQCDVSRIVPCDSIRRSEALLTQEARLPARAQITLYDGISTYII